MRARLATLVLACSACSASPSDPRPPTEAGPSEPASTPSLGPELGDFHSFDARPWPSEPSDRQADPLFDRGAWFGFALPDDAHLGSFAGPFDLRRPGWIAARGLSLELEGLRVDPARSSVEREPGLLRQRLTYGCDAPASCEDVELTLELDFDGPRQLSVRAELRSETPLELLPRWTGELFPGTELRAEGTQLELRSAARSTPLTLHFGPQAQLELDASGLGYRAKLPALSLDHPAQLQLCVSAEPGASCVPAEPDAKRERWRGYLEAVAAARELTAPELALALKSVETLVSNWREPDADIAHAGLFPAWAYDGFHGFWAWDSWKHAVALAHFEPELAREQIRLMFAYARADGMVPDVVYPGPEDDNWRDTKPPLATWAVEAVYARTGDLAFVEELLPALLRYHAWWYRDRDHDRDGLCEYGSTDGTRIAAAWESGMDNAVRFDGAQMVQNAEQAYSLDIESVDLNAYLYVDKRGLARLLRASGGDEARAAELEREAEAIAERIRSEHWDEELGWFRDRRLDGSFAPGMGPEGFIPLWAGIAAAEQAERIRASMVDPQRFGTKVPLGTLAADDPNFDPARGYWRGPVWLDQAYFGLAGLRHYGFDADADALQSQLLDNAEGLRGGAAIRENYHPLTGAGQNARHFSWSAASVLLMLWRHPAP